MDYKEIIDILKTNNVFLTGKGGTGKSYTTNKIIKHYKEQDKRIAVLGSTGIAAANIKGQTIHSFFKIGISKNFQEFNNRLEYIENENYKAYLKLINYLSYLKYYSLIIIDEISMVSADLLDLIYYILKQFEFKGKLLLVGDFLQLPPVVKGNEEVKFAFESNTWKKLNLSNIQLDKVHRTDNDVFIYSLNKLREGKLDDKALNYFISLTSEKNKLKVKENMYTIICSTNKQVDYINNAKLNKIKGEKFINKRKISYNHDGNSESFKNWLDFNKQKIRSFIQSLLCDEEFKYKVGCQVMFINNNIKEEDGKEKFIWFNGEKGTIIGISEYEKVVENNLLNKSYEKVKDLIVEKENGDRVNVSLACWELSYLSRTGMKMEKVNICSVYQYPLKLSYSATYHKVQGASIDNLIVNTKNIFAPSQFYVGLSRATNPDNLYIHCKSNPKEYFKQISKVNPKVIEFYKNLG